MTEKENKVAVDYSAYIDAITRDSDDLGLKGYDFSRDADPTNVNEIWSEEVKAFADMQTIESLFFSEDWVFIIVDLIAQKLSSQYMHVMKKEIVDGKEVIEFDDDHPLNKLIDRPNDFQDYHAWMYSTIVQYTLLGNAIQWYSSKLNQIVCLRTSQVSINFDPRGMIKEYIMGDRNEDNPIVLSKSSSIQFKPQEIAHIRRPNPASLIWGLTPFIPGRKSVLFNRYSSDYLNSFYLKQATPGMIVEMDRQVNEAQALRQLRSFEMAYTGRRNQRRTMILPKGVKATPSSHTIADQRITELINNNRESTLALLKVPKHEVGLQTSGSLGSEEYKRSISNFWEATLIPTARMIEGSLNAFFAKKLGDNFFLQFNLDQVEALQEDQNAKADIAKKYLDSGWSLNEVRTKVFDLPPIDDKKADDPWLMAQTQQPSLPFGLSQMSNNDMTKLDEPIEKTPQIEDNQGIQTNQRLEHLRSVVESRKQGWLGGVRKAMEDVSEGSDGKNMEILALETLTTLAEIAEPIIRQSLIDTKSADLPNPKELEKRLNDAFKTMQPEYAEAYQDILTSSVELGYNQQLDLVINEQDRQKLEAIRAREADNRRSILGARGIESFGQISETHTERIMRTIERGIEKQDSITEIIAAIRETLGDAEALTGKASTIGRTETLTAVSIGQGQAFENASQIIDGLKKGWLDAGDERVRNSHTRADGVGGEVVAANENFSNGLRWPRDLMAGDPSEVINCRCTLVTLFPGEDLEDV